MYARTLEPPFGGPQAAAVTRMPSQPPPFVRPSGLFAHKKLSNFLQDETDAHNISLAIDSFKRKKNVGCSETTAAAAAATMQCSGANVDNHMGLSEMTSSSSSSLSSLSSSRTTEQQESSTSSSSSSSTTSQRRHRHLLSEMTSTCTSSSETQNAQQQQRLLQHHRLADDVVAAAAANDDPLVTFPESPPALMSNVSPMLHASAARPRPVRTVAATSNAAAAVDERVSSQLVEEAYESSTSNSTRVSDSQDSVLHRSLHLGGGGGADVWNHHSALGRSCKLPIVDYGVAKNALNNFQEKRILQMKTGELTSQQGNQNTSAATMKMQTDSFSSEQKASSAQQQKHTITSSGMFNHEKHIAQTSKSNFTITKGICTSSNTVSSATSQSSSHNNGSSTGGGGGGGAGVGGGVGGGGGCSPPSGAGVALRTVDELLSMSFDDLDRMREIADPADVKRAIAKYSAYLERAVGELTSGKCADSRGPMMLNKLFDMICKAWAVPTYELGDALCNAIRVCGGVDLLINNCVSKDQKLQFSSARLLEQCMTTKNRAHVVVVEKGLEKVVHVVCAYKSQVSSADQSKVSTGILEHLFKHSEVTCSDVIRLGGLDVLLYECRRRDIATLRHCAGALANLSLYGGAENQELMIKRNVPTWLFTLAFNTDDNIKYYAFLAIAVLVANKEIEAAVLKSETLDLIDPFVTTHTPSEFAKSNLAHAHGQSQHWLQRLVPVLSSIREEACNLAAFHFCMEAGIKKRQGKTGIFREINAIEPLKKVASCPNAIASRFAAQALKLIGEQVPHKLSQQVPLWSSEDVREWVKQIGFDECAAHFVDSRVDGDLLLQLTEDNLRDDIGIHNGIMRRRFMREIHCLKRLADYSSKDSTSLNSFLQSIGSEFSVYTYSMLNAGVDRDSIRFLSEDQLSRECGISNSIHRYRILDSIRDMETLLETSSCEENMNKNLDVFISYRRSTGSQLASLLKVHLQLRGYSVFIDVERLEAGKFDNHLLQSIKQAKNFLLVLTPNSLDRCIGDNECNDWVHKEIVAALEQCNIIPIMDNFEWPDEKKLPADMRNVQKFNGVRWIHDYQDACVEKVERFMNGTRDGASSGLSLPSRSGGGGSSTVKSDQSAPNTPLTLGRSPPTYQRTQSNDSERDLNGSKD